MKTINIWSEEETKKVGEKFLRLNSDNDWNEEKSSYTTMASEKIFQKKEQGPKVLPVG